MEFTNTGRYIKNEPQIQSLPFTHSLVSRMRQERAAALMMQQEADLDAIEDRALAMFGIQVDYCMDERIITHE